MSKSKKIPQHPALEFIRPYLGPCREPETLEEQLVEAISLRLMFDGFPGFEQGVHVIRDSLVEWEVDPDRGPGRRAFETCVDKAICGEYGDFNRWISCESCGKEFNPERSLAYADKVLTAGALCPACI